MGNEHDLKSPGSEPSVNSSATRSYIRFGFQAAGLAVGTAALITMPVLSFVGFTGIGPGAGTIAASWQASQCLVQAGSLFAICQVGLLPVPENTKSFKLTL